MRIIAGLTALYVILIAILFYIFIFSNGYTIGGIVFAEISFAFPMIIAFLLAIKFKRSEDRRILLSFEIGFFIFSMLVFIGTFGGEHDAQYQLALLIIPLIGFPAVTIMGFVVAFSQNRQSE